MTASCGCGFLHLPGRGRPGCTNDRREATWTCMVCVPHLFGQGGQREFARHYNKHHLDQTRKDHHDPHQPIAT